MYKASFPRSTIKESHHPLWKIQGYLFLIGPAVSTTSNFLPSHLFQSISQLHTLLYIPDHQALSLQRQTKYIATLISRPSLSTSPLEFLVVSVCLNLLLLGVLERWTTMRTFRPYLQHPQPRQDIPLVDPFLVGWGLIIEQGIMVMVRRRSPSLRIVSVSLLKNGPQKMEPCPPFLVHCHPLLSPQQERYSYIAKYLPLHLSIHKGKCLLETQ